MNIITGTVAPAKSQPDVLAGWSGTRMNTGKKVKRP